MPVEAVVDLKKPDQPPVDKNVRVPKHVTDAAKRAEAYYQPPPGDAQAQPDIRQPDPPPQLDIRQPEPPAPPPAAPQVGDSEWKQRYDSMKGRYDKAAAELKGLQQQQAVSNGEIMQLKDAVRRLQAPPAPEPGPRLISEKEEQEYGQEFISVAKKAAIEALAPKLNELENENKVLRQENARNSIQWVYEALNREVPQWEAINGSPQFVEWLRLRDPFSGAIRHESLTAAFQAADAPRVVAIFNRFVSEIAVSDPAPQVPAAPAQPPRQAAVKLEDLAAPGRVRSAPPPVAAEKPIYTRAQVNQFYRDSAKGRYDGRKAEYERIQADIIAAGREGRIR